MKNKKAFLSLTIISNITNRRENNSIFLPIDKDESNVVFFNKVYLLLAVWEMRDLVEFVGKPQTIKEVNLSTVEQLLHNNGPLSKPQLAKMTGLSLPTVNKLVDELEAHRYIRQVGPTGNGVGRKAMVYEIDRTVGCLIALYYRWGTYLCRITDIIGDTLYEGSHILDNSTAETAFSTTVAAIDDLIQKAPFAVKSIGIGVPGAVLPDGTLSGIPKIDVWEGYNLLERLKSKYAVDIWVENDVNLAGVGYYYANLAEQYNHLVYIYVGNGMGSSAILNRKLFRGSTNFAGELGFMAPLSGQNPKENYAAKGGFLETQMRQFVDSAQELFKVSTDPELRQQLINLLAGAAANYIAILNPDAIVFGGEAFRGDMIEELVAEIQQQIIFYSAQVSIPPILYDPNANTGIEGLVFTCRAGINTWTQLVQGGGV